MREREILTGYTLIHGTLSSLVHVMPLICFIYLYSYFLFYSSLSNGQLQCNVPQYLPPSSPSPFLLQTLYAYEEAVAGVQCLSSKDGQQAKGSRQCQAGDNTKMHTMLPFGSLYDVLREHSGWSLAVENRVMVRGASQWR